MSQAFICAPGDPSVGIYSFTTSVRLPHFEPGDEREWVRALLTECFASILDDDVGIHFDDECADCLQIGKHHNNCPSKPQPPAEGG